MTRNEDSRIVFRMTIGTRTLPSTNWMTMYAIATARTNWSVDGRGDNQGRDRPDQGADERDRFGQPGDDPEEQRRRKAKDRIDGPSRYRHRSHQDQLAADPEPEPRLDLVPRLAHPGTAFERDERQGVALEPGMLGHPEEDEREQRHEGGYGLRDRRPTDTTSSGFGSPPPAKLPEIESMTAITIEDNPSGRTVCAHSRARSKEAGSSVVNRSIWPTAVGTTRNATATTDTAKRP